METITFPYAVIYNGEIIPANTPIKVKKEEAVAKNATTTKPTKKAVKSNDNT